MVLKMRDGSLVLINERWIEHLVEHTEHVLPLKLSLLQKTGELFGIAYFDVQFSRSPEEHCRDPDVFL